MIQNSFLASNRELILRLAAIHGAKNIRVFGSAVREDFSSESDLDLMVEMEQDRDYLDLVGLWQDLEEKLGRKVDLLTDGGVSPYLKEKIYGEMRPL